jgi:arylsulfatase A-like enzyme
MKKQPNILFLFSDQHRAQAMSCAGDPNIDTPNLDRLANEGIRFTNAYSNTPLCSPFRASLYTGQYPTTHGVISLQRPLLPQQPYLPEVLQKEGYYTSHMGKWHLSGGECPCHFVSPYFRPGWNEWLGWENSNQPFKTTYCQGNDFQVHVLDGYQTDALTDLTIEWIKINKDKSPWFHVFSCESPHGPNIAPEPYMKMFSDRKIEFRENFGFDHPDKERFKQELRGYYAQVKNLDDNIGRILASLHETDQLDNTIIFYFSDHGDFMGSHGWRQKSRPEEESSNIPLIIRHPKKIPSNHVSDALISCVDFMPTILGYLGIECPGSVDGQDFSALLTAKSKQGAEMVFMQYEFPYYQEDLNTVYRAIRIGVWLYVRSLTGDNDKLYDLEQDPFQMENLYTKDDHAEVLKELQKKLAQKCASIGDKFFKRKEEYHA